jgi:hypothetical protein
MWEMTSGWDLIAAISALVVAAVAVTGISFAARQLREARATRRIEVFSQILERFGSVEQREARRFIFTNFTFCSLASLPDDKREMIEMVLASCDRVSYLTLNKLVPKEDVLELLGRRMIKVWDCSQAFIDARREQAGEKAKKKDPYGYLANFETFVEKYRATVKLKA